MQIELRADSGFGVPAMYEVCERLDVQYTIGLGMNATLKARSEPLLAFAVAQYDQTGQMQRRFCDFWYQAQSWPAQRRVVVKVEVGPQGTNRRAVVTNRPGVLVLPGATYDEYADRGESENRNKEFKVGLAADRLSDHRFMANLFRLYLHTVAYNLLAHLRRWVADPPTDDPRAEVPWEALLPRPRRHHFNRRRERDPLGEGHACTWRTRLIKVAAQFAKLRGAWSSSCPGAGLILSITPMSVSPCWLCQSTPIPTDASPKLSPRHLSRPTARAGGKGVLRSTPTTPTADNQNHSNSPPTRRPMNNPG